MKNRSNQSRIMLFASVLVMISVTFCGCITLFEGSETNKKLVSYYGEHSVTGARFYMDDYASDDMITEELQSDRVQELVEKLESMKLKYHAFHTDYFWGGKYGVELDLDDGTYLRYDGTKLEHYGVSVKNKSTSADMIKGCFLEVTDCEFWEEMSRFFTTVVPEELASW